MEALRDRLGALNLPEIENWNRILTAVVVMIVGLFVIRVVSRIVIRALGQGLRESSREIVRKAIIYFGVSLLAVGALNAAGVSVGALLGAAGVFGIAIGIASQASLSNIISGLFLVSERFFEIGDVVRAGENTGVIASIDLLSIKIRTFDNVLIRVPNQRLIENELVNVTKYPIRRMDFIITNPYSQSIPNTLSALRRAAAACRTALEEPEPIVMFRGHTANGWEALCGVWFERARFVDTRNEMAAAIQSEYDADNLVIRGTVIHIEQGGNVN